MAATNWEANVKEELDKAIANLRQGEQEQFKDWLRDRPDPPIDRWRTNEEWYSSIDLTNILGRSEYCHHFVRDALRYYLHHIVNTEGDDIKYEENAIGLARLVNLVYYVEKRAETGGEILNEVLDAIISCLSKFPRWIKVDVLTKSMCTGCPIYVAVRLFNGFESPSEPLPRSLLQSAAFTKDHFYYDPIREGYSVPTRIMGWGSNRLSNLGCHQGSSVDQKDMLRLPKFGGSRVTAFSIGVDHSLFLNENRKLYVTGRLKNWTGRWDDERIALTPLEVKIPDEERFIQSTHLRCHRIYAGTTRSEILFSSPPMRQGENQVDICIVAGPGPKGISKEPRISYANIVLEDRPETVHHTTEEIVDAVMKDERFIAAETSHMVTDNRFIYHAFDRTHSIRFKGSKKNKLDIELSVDDRGGFLVSDSSKSLPRELRICVGNVVHRPHSIRQSAFCDNGDVFCLLQVDRMARNYTLVKGEVRLLRVDQMEWKSKKAGKEQMDVQYYLVAEEVAGAEHAVQFSVDRNGDNLLFEMRDQPRSQSFDPVFSPNDNTLNVCEDPQMCYGGATRSLELLQHERECGNVLVDGEELISLSPHSDFLCPRSFLSEEMISDLKEESPIEKRNKESSKGKKKSNALSYFITQQRVDRIEMEICGQEKDKFAPIPDRYYGSSFEKGSLQLSIPRIHTKNIDMRTKEYEDNTKDVIWEDIARFAEDLFPFHYPNVKVCITGRSEAYIFVTIRPEIVFGSLECESKLRGLKLLRVTYNGQHEFDIAENLWELHTPHFIRSVFHSSAMTPVVECPFPEILMRMCERAFIDPSSTEDYTTNQLLNMLDVADYLCANLLAEDVVYRLLRNATRIDINETLQEILHTLNSRSSLISVLARFPHILLDWPIDIDNDLLYETCESMQKIVGPVMRGVGTVGVALSPTPSHCNLSLFILASTNSQLAVRPNELPLSNEPNRISAMKNILENLPCEDTALNLIDREDRLSLLFDSFRGEKGIMEKSKKIFDECTNRFENGRAPLMCRLDPQIPIDLEEWLTTVPLPEPASAPTPKEKGCGRRTRRKTEGRSEREGEKEGEEKKEEKKEQDEEIVLNNNKNTASSPVEMRQMEARATPCSLATIIKEEEEMEAAKKQSTPKRSEGGRRSKFRPLSFSDSGPSTHSKNVDTKHDWTQSPRPETKGKQPAKSFTEIMKEQSERKSGVTRRRGPSVSGCQMEEAAIEELANYYREIIEDHQLVSVEVCRNEEEEGPRWSADGELYLE